ncbi:MAG: AraC family transcriptional regulator [Akkermansiaceae bacterium]
MSAVAQIAESLGFSSVHYFTTAFKREVGMTPEGYRARH